MAATLYRDLAGIPQELADFAGYAAGQPFFVSLDWYRCLAKSGLQRTGEVRVYVCSGSSAPVALFGLGDRQAGYLGSLTSMYTPRFGLTTRGEAPAAAIADLGKDLAREGWRVIELRYLRADSADTRALVAALTRAGYAVDLYFQYGNWYSMLAGVGYEAYLEGRPGYLRNLLERKARALGRAHDVRFELLQAPGPGLESAIEDYGRVYAASWKRPEVCPALVPDLIRCCAGLGILRLGLLYVDGVPSAAQVWIVDRGVADIFKLVHARQYDRYSIGSLLSARMFRHALDVDRVTEVDYGLGDERYKSDWLDRRRQIVGLEAVDPRTARGRLLLARRAARNALRRVGLRAWEPVEV